jgi:hypothetical protein
MLITDGLSLKEGAMDLWLVKEHFQNGSSIGSNNIIASMQIQPLLQFILICVASPI